MQVFYSRPVLFLPASLVNIKRSKIWSFAIHQTVVATHNSHPHGPWIKMATDDESQEKASPQDYEEAASLLETIKG